MNSKGLSISARYSMLQGNFWMLYGIGYGFVSVFLLGRGLTAGLIGLITAIFGTGSALLQPLFGRLADRNDNWHWKKILVLLSGLAAIMSVLVCFINTPLGSGLLWGIMLMLLSTMLSFVNGANFYYLERKEKLNFGFSRGLGSLCYAVITTILGKLVEPYGVDMVAFVGVAAWILLFIISVTMPFNGKRIDQADAGMQDGAKNDTADKLKRDINDPQDNRSFIRKYPAFSIMLVGSVFWFIFHNITNTYLIQIVENVGGNSDHMGTALSIAAVCEIPVMFAFKYIIDRFKINHLMLVIGAAYIVKALLMLVAGSIAFIYAAEIAQIFSFAIFAPGSIYYADEHMRDEDKSTGQALISTTIIVGTVLGNLLGGRVLDVSSVSTMLFVGLASAVIGTVFAVVSVLMDRAAPDKAKTC